MLLHYAHKQVNGTGRWKVPADDMKHTRKLVTIMENCQQQQCQGVAFSLSQTPQVSPGSCGLASSENSETLSYILIQSPNAVCQFHNLITSYITTMKTCTDSTTTWCISSLETAKFALLHHTCPLLSEHISCISKAKRHCTEITITHHTYKKWFSILFC